ncbi:MAG: hypothetical protein JWN23_2214 [Rhodocyclales bacterium]|nr:hypothetical protein [Rhodocyclales bacterium]
MPDANALSSISPVAAAAPASGGNASNATASQGNDGQPTFSQVLRDKQSAAADANASASANADATRSANAQAQDKTAQANDAAANKATDGKANSKQTSDAADAEAPAKTPAEMAQLLAAAGLLANVSNTQTPTSDAADASAVSAATNAAAVVASTAASNATQAATDPNVIAATSQSDKTAAVSTQTAASLAANAANTTAFAEQALGAQAQLPNTGSKSAQSGTSGGEQQAAGKQPLLAVSNNGDTDKTRAETAASETSFAAALERAGQNGDAARGAAATTNVTQTQTSQTPATVHVVNTPVGRQGWADEVGQRVLWTAKSDSSRADLVLNPPQLGRIEVSIHMNGDQASASFMVANPTAREALQDAMPRLREMMSQAGIQLGQADVGAGQSGQNSAQGERRQSASDKGSDMLNAVGAIGTAGSGWTRQGIGVVDTFA